MRSRPLEKEILKNYKKYYYKYQLVEELNTTLYTLNKTLENMDLDLNKYYLERQKQYEYDLIFRQIFDAFKNRKHCYIKNSRSGNNHGNDYQTKTYYIVKDKNDFSDVIKFNIQNNTRLIKISFKKIKTKKVKERNYFYVNALGIKVLLDKNKKIMTSLENKTQIDLTQLNKKDLEKYIKESIIGKVKKWKQ